MKLKNSLLIIIIIINIGFFKNTFCMEEAPSQEFISEQTDIPKKDINNLKSLVAISIKKLENIEKLKGIVPDDLIEKIREIIELDNQNLIRASEAGDIEQVKYLLENKNINVNAKNLWKDTPLLTATKNGHLQVVELLLQRNANPNIKDSSGQTPLMVAAEKGFKYIAEILITAKADLDAKDFGGEFTALMKACRKGEFELVKLLVNAGALVNVTDNWGNTAILIAIDQATMAKGNSLNSTGIDLERFTDEYINHKNIIEFLIEAGAQVSSCTMQQVLYAIMGHAPYMYELLNKYMN